MHPPSVMSLAAQICVSGIAFVAFSALVFWPLEELFAAEGTARPKLKDLAYLVVLPIVRPVAGGGDCL